MFIWWRWFALVSFLLTFLNSYVFASSRSSTVSAMMSLWSTWNLLSWVRPQCIHPEACSSVEPAAIVPVTVVQKDFNVGGGRLLHSRSESIFLMKLCILIKRTQLVSITVWKHQHFVPHELYLIRTDSNESLSVFVQWIRSFFSPGSRLATPHVAWINTFYVAFFSLFLDKRC